MSFKDLCEQRFSARKFTDEQVSPSDLNYIMECVQLAPSACNRQPWLFLVVKSESQRRLLHQCYPREWFASAPMYVIALRSTQENWVRPDDAKSHGDIDVSIALEHLCLAATERGLSTCWVCNYDVHRMSEFFPREGYEAVAIIPIGHAAPDCPHAEKKRKPLADIIEEL